MKTTRRILSLVLCFVMLFSFSYTSLAAESIGKELWDLTFDAESESFKAAVTMFPGKNEKERIIAWYSDSAEGHVELKQGGEASTVKAKAKSIPQGGYRLSATLEELEKGKYSYRCISGEFKSSAHTFTVSDDDTLTALYVSDIHISADDENDKNRLCNSAYNYDRTLDKAYLKSVKNGDALDIVLSGGDQAGEGLFEEYKGLSTPSLTKSVPFAPTVGNHDRKSVNYKHYTALPNEGDFTFRSYIGTDWWTRQGDVLILMLDSCNCSMKEHYNFMKQAIAQNEDAKWIVASIHHDMFGGREAWLEGENKLLRMMWVPFFDEFGIDLVLYGHSHYYSVSNVIYGSKTVSETGHNAKVKDPEGTIYLSSGSINNLAPLVTDEGEVPPIGENAGYTFLEEEIIYNLLEFTDKTLTVKSYTVDSDELFNTLTIEKTSKKGGHSYKNSAWYLKGLAFFAGRIVNIINNYDMYKRYVNDGYEVSLKEGLIGS